MPALLLFFSSVDVLGWPIEGEGKEKRLGTPKYGRQSIGERENKEKFQLNTFSTIFYRILVCVSQCQCLGPSRKWRRQVISDTFLSRSFYFGREKQWWDSSLSLWQKWSWEKRGKDKRVESLLGFPPCMQVVCCCCRGVAPRVPIEVGPFLGRTTHNSYRRVEERGRYKRLHTRASGTQQKVNGIVVRRYKDSLGRVYTPPHHLPVARLASNELLLLLLRLLLWKSSADGRASYKKASHVHIGTLVFIQL